MQHQTLHCSNYKQTSHIADYKRTGRRVYISPLELITRRNLFLDIKYFLHNLGRFLKPTTDTTPPEKAKSLDAAR